MDHLEKAYAKKLNAALNVKLRPLSGAGGGRFRSGRTGSRNNRVATIEEDTTEL